MAGKRKKNQRKTIILIVVMLLLCVAASLYILKLAGGGFPQDNTAENTENQETPSAEEIAQAEEEAAAKAAAEAEAALLEQAASHVYSHRGAGGEDELSEVAYEQAVAAGSKFIEADMVVSAQGTIYVSHDDYAKDMTGIDGYFSGMTDAQIDAITTRAGHKMLKLRDLCDKYGDTVTYLVDIKYSSNRNFNALADLIREYDNADNVIVTSFYLDAISPFERNFPDMKKLYLCYDQATFNVALNASYLDILCVPKEIMNADNLKAAHDSGKQFSAWVLNSEEEIRSAIDLGVDSYFTDDTGIAIDLEKQYRTE